MQMIDYGYSFCVQSQMVRQTLTKNTVFPDKQSLVFYKNGVYFFELTYDAICFAGTKRKRFSFLPPYISAKLFAKVDFEIVIWGFNMVEKHRAGRIKNEIK